MVIFLWMFVIFLGLCSCTPYENKNPKKDVQSGKYNFISSGEKYFSPDESTPSDWLNTFIYDKDSIFFALYNSYLGELNLFNLNDGHLMKKNKYPLSGKDGITYNGCDIYVQDYNSAAFYKLNENGIIDTIIPWKTNKLRIPPSRVNIFNSVYDSDCSIYFVTYTMGEFDDDKRFVLLEYNKENDSICYYVNYPITYRKSNWGGALYRQVYSCSNTMQNSIIFSFPVSHSIFVFDCKSKKTKEYYCGSSYINEIKSLSNNKDKRLNAQDSYSHFMKNNSYGPIIYDKYRNVYYRIFEIPYKNHNGDYFKKIGIIILDDKFRIIGEQMFGAFHGTTILVIPEGILIPKIAEYPVLDSPLSFYFYKISKE